MGARENKCQISQNDILHIFFSEFYLGFHSSCEIGQGPMKNCLWCYCRKLIISIVLALKSLKRAILFKLFW